MTGYSHHPYNFPLAPNLKSRDPDFVALADTPRLESFLDGAFAAYGQSRSGGVPIFFTEYGYQTKPPDPLGISWAKQASYLNESEYMAWNFTRGPVDLAVPARRRQAQLSLRTGLDQVLGHVPDRAARARRLTQGLVLQLPGADLAAEDARQGAPFVPGLGHAPQRRQRRPPAGHGPVRRTEKGRRYKALKTVTTTDPRGYMEAKVAVPKSGSVRIAWHNPGGRPTNGAP